MKYSKRTIFGTGPGPDDDMISYLSLGWSKSDSANTAVDAKVRLVPELRNGKPVIVVKNVAV